MAHPVAGQAAARAVAGTGEDGPVPDQLLTAQGRDLLARLAGEEVTPERALALSTALRERYPADLVAAALTQQALRAAGRAKFGAADSMLFTRAGLEQASSDLTARHAASRFAGFALIADLCCGIGGNLVSLAALPGRPAVVAVDADPTSLEFARHNVDVATGTVPTAARVGYVRADVRDIRLTGFDAVFVDPARRDQRGRLPAGQYRPPLAWCLGLADVVPAVGIKAAPGLRTDVVPPGWEIEFVAVGRDLKEALIFSPALATASTRATVLIADETPAAVNTLTAAVGDRPAAPLAPPGAYLLDPNPAVTRAGLVTDLAVALGAWQIDPMIAFLSSDQPLRTPFARTLRVLESAPWHERRFAARLRELGIGAADIRRRGLAGDVRQIHRRLGLRGEGAATIVLTRVSDQPWGLICDPLR
ncbi:MAG: class I SAM-dependent methyltransferase [Actinomycetota bacterium]|nr:class I SAM-dependent methyltransferase [Actinomycetota bacterium]